ncbi:MAG TPA: hypothetical protein VL689_19440 [Paraburkholderia sp.]|nr:hypothetical protein [Paraburkholderia sp.]
MKSLKIAVLACSLFAASISAYAQSAGPAASAPQPTAKTSTSQPAARAAEWSAATPAKKGDDCTGPASFCNIYFGS